MKLDRNRLEELIQEELADLLEQRPLAKAPAARAGRNQPTRSGSEAARRVVGAPEDAVGDWKELYGGAQRETHGKPKGKNVAQGITAKQAGKFAASKPEGHVSAELTDTMASGKKGDTERVTDTSIQRGDSALKYGDKGQYAGKDYVFSDRSIATGGRGGTHSGVSQHFGRKRKSYKNIGQKMKDDPSTMKRQAAANVRGRGNMQKESTMKLTRNDLRQLVQEEVGVLLEQPGGAGVDTSGVQQSHKVTQVLRIIDGMREDEINALMAAMKTAGLPIAM
jgi:hypothetical protein